MSSETAELLATEIERIFRQEHGRAVAVLTRLAGDLDVAEEAVQDAFVAGLERWPITGVPPNPAAWIITTARHRAIDRFRRESSREDRHAEAARRLTRDNPVEESAIADDQLRLIFACCHPALGHGSQIALTLRLLGGVSTAEIARAFLVPEATMAQRLVRAKGKIRDARIPLRMPEVTDLPERLSAVLAVLYLIFNEGYLPGTGEELVREDLCGEGIRLGRLLVELLPDEPEAQGLLALMLLIDARRAARAGADGVLVPLKEQDRSRWDWRLIREGQGLVRGCLRRNRPGPYQLQAAINAVHSDSRGGSDTDWRQIVSLYDQLLTLAPNPVAELHRAVALAEVEGPAPALALVEPLPLEGTHLYHAIRADLLRRLGRSAEAVAAYRAAVARTGNRMEAAFLERRLSEMIREPGGRPVPVLESNSAV